MRKMLLALIGAAAAILVTGLASRPDKALRVATGLVSHTVCSTTFLSGLDPAEVYAETFAPFPGIRWLGWGLRYDVDSAQRRVTMRFAGGFESRAIYRDGLGCILVHGAEPAQAWWPATVEAMPFAPPVPDIAGPAVAERADMRLRAALDRLFAPADHPPERWTKAVVVLHDGRIVAERYAPGYGIDTPLLGWSISKSMINALIGILVRQGRLALDAPAPVAEWALPGDPRHAITIDELLRMTSGLAIDETNTGFDPSSRMLFLADDMAGFAASAPLEAPPGRVWSYASPNTLILSRIIRDAVGGRAQDVLGFARRELIEPLGMRDVTIEFDATGTPVGSTYIFASARDWARFGRLYLDDGVIRGRRLLPKGWVGYSSRRTLDSIYAAGFWLGPQEWRGHLPPDTFFAGGTLGQRLVIIPSERLVVARFGMMHGPDADIPALGRFIGEVIAVLHEGAR